MINELIKYLDIYIEEYSRLYKEYKNNLAKQNLYQELFNCLNRPENEIKYKLGIIKIIIDEIYQNDIYYQELNEIINNEQTSNTIQYFINNMYKDYEEIKVQTGIIHNRIIRNKEKMISAKRIKICLEKEKQIYEKNNDMSNLRKIIYYLETSGIISNKQELLLLNEIEYYNRKIINKNNQEELNYIETLYQDIPNVVNSGYELFEDIEVLEDKQDFLDKLSKEIITTIPSIKNEEIIELIEHYKKYNLQDNEYYYLIVSLLKYYQEDLMTYNTLILQKEEYIKPNERKEIIKNYYNSLDKYLLIRKYYDDQISTIIDINIDTNSQITENEEIIDNQEERILIYSYSKSNITKAKIISDLSDISYEYYDDIYDLITSFKNGTISQKEIKQLIGDKRLKGKLELKRDQIRIVFKHVKDNIYNVYGVFIKKDDNDLKTYAKLVTRIIPDISDKNKLNKQLELSKHTEELLENIIKEKGRKNGR